MTEWPLTAVATALALISVAANSFEIALETVTESTIIESTTISGAIGSSPRCATSMPARVRLSSTALMLEEPTSRPTIVFDPNPNMCPPFVAPATSPADFLLLSRRLRRCPRFLLAHSRFQFHGLFFHPLVELRFLEAPAVAQFEGRNLLLVDVLVERVRTDSQVLRSLANIHHFPRVGHSAFSPSTEFQFSVQLYCPPVLTKLGEPVPRSECVRVSFGVLSISERGEWASPRESSGFLGFYGVFVESSQSGAAESIYCLGLRKHRPPRVVVFIRMMLQSPRHE